MIKTDGNSYIEHRPENGIENSWSAVYAKRLFDEHIEKSNPHAITKETVELGNVDNIKQAAKDEFDSHTSNKNNPHSVTKAQLGLGNVDNIKQATKAEFDIFSQATQKEISDVRDEIPKNVSELVNDSGYLTEHQDISHKADASYVDNADSAINERINKTKYYDDADIEISPDEWFTFEDEAHTTLTGFSEGHESETSIVIPNSVTSIGGGAFLACSSLTSITIPNSVTSIGYDAFLACSSLTSIVIPNSVTSIGYAAFEGCSSLTSITIPNSVTNIGGDVFKYCSSLTSITIPNSVTSIGGGAFLACSSLTSIVIPNSVTSIGYAAFEGCSSLTSITIPNSVTSIGYDAFLACSSLTSITIPNSVTSIGGGAFGYCSSLTSITIPNSVTSISEEAFQYCDNLTIYCSQGSYAETHAKNNMIPVVYTDVQENSITSPVKTSIDDTVVANVIYDLGLQTAINIILPSGKIGDFIQVDFISGEAETTLTVNSPSGLIGFDLIPGINTIYTLYFDWGDIGYGGETVTYGWRFNYSEYPIDVI